MAVNRERRLALVIILSTAYLILELAIGFKYNSLALVADAFHVSSDIIAFTVTLLVMRLVDNDTSHASHHSHSHGHGHNDTSADLDDDTQSLWHAKAPLGLSYGWQRAELLGAFFNGVFLLGLALSVFLQAVQRLIYPEVVTDPNMVMITAGIGIAFSILSACIVQHGHGHGHGHSHGHSHGHGHDHNALHFSTILHLLLDALNSLLVLLSALITRLTGLNRADALAALVLSVFLAGGGLGVAGIDLGGAVRAIPSLLGLERLSRLGSGLGRRFFGFGSGRSSHRTSHRRPYPWLSRTGAIWALLGGVGDVDLRGVERDVVRVVFSGKGGDGSAKVGNDMNKSMGDTKTNVAEQGYGGWTAGTTASSTPVGRTPARTPSPVVPSTPAPVHAHGVQGVHEVHVWGLTPSKRIATLHVATSNDSLRDFMESARAISECLHNWGIHNVTIQPELVDEPHLQAEQLGDPNDMPASSLTYPPTPYPSIPLAMDIPASLEATSYEYASGSSGVRGFGPTLIPGVGHGDVSVHAHRDVDVEMSSSHPGAGSRTPSASLLSRVFRTTRSSGPNNTPFPSISSTSPSFDPHAAPLPAVAAATGADPRAHFQSQVPMTGNAFASRCQLRCNMVACEDMVCCK